jgi:hypothetical protein
LRYCFGQLNKRIPSTPCIRTDLLQTTQEHEATHSHGIM